MMVVIGFAQQRVSEELVSRVLDGLLFDVIGRLDPFAVSHRVRTRIRAVHRQQRLVEVGHRARVLVVLGERGHAPQGLARAAFRVVHHFHRVDGAIRVQRPPLVRDVRLVRERAGRAVQIEAVVAPDDRLETVVVVVVVIVVIIVVVVVGERKFVVVPL